MSHPVHLILSPGTRIVTRNDANRLGGGESGWKYAMHLTRLLLSGISALREGELSVRLDEHRATLLAIKRGEQPWPELNALRLRLQKTFDDVFASNPIGANEFLVRARRKM